MTHLEIDRFREWFDYVNAERLRDNRPLIQPFYPYEFLKGRIHDDRASIGGNKQKEPVTVDAHSELRRFVFLKGTCSDINELVYSDANLLSDVRLRRYLDPTGEQALVPDDEMSRFLQSCMDYRERFELAPPQKSISFMDRVQIRSGLYQGYEATVVRARLSRGTLHLDLALPMLKNRINIHMKDVPSKDVIPLNPVDVNALRSDFIRYTQTHLLDILSHRAFLMEQAEREKRRSHNNPSAALTRSLNERHKSDLETFRQDADLLERILRYRDYEIDNASARAHFTALMLITAHLCRDSRVELLLRDTVLQLLDQVRKDSDIRAYLLIAMKISTDKPSYRDEVKDYVRRRQPKSTQLRSFVTLICKKVRY